MSWANAMKDYENENENFERVDDFDRDDRDFHLIGISHFGAFGIPAALWMGVIFFYPLIWAIGTAAAIVVALGYGTAKGILKIRSNRPSH